MDVSFRRVDSGQIGQPLSQPKTGKVPEGQFGRHSISATSAELRPPRQEGGPGQMQRTASLSNLSHVQVSDPQLLRPPPRTHHGLPPLPPTPTTTPPSTTTPTTTASAPPPAPTLQASAAAKTAMALPGPQLADRERIIDGNELRTRLGHDPKKNAKLFGFAGPRVWGRSETYKGVLNSLDRYQQQMQNTVADRNGATRGQQVQDLTRLLDKAERSIDRRLAKKDEQPMQDLRAMVQRERQLLQGIANGKDLPASANVSFQKLLDLRHVGMPLTAGSDLATYNAANEKNPPGRTALGSGQVNTVFRVEYNGDPVPKAFKQVASQDTSPNSMAGIAGIDRNAPAYAARNVATSMINDQLGLDVIPKTRFAEHGSERGIVMDLVTGKAPGEAASQGMPLDDAAHRKISAEQSKLDRGATKPEDFQLNMKLLGFKIDSASDEWRLHPSNGSQIDLKEPALQNKLNDLEWLDIITGQLDRNSTNYLVTFDANGKPNGVKGIDNDFSLGTAHPNPNNVAKTNLPRMIDSQTAASIELMGRDWNQPGGMKERLSEMLSPNEVANVESRLFGKPDPKGFKGVLAHINDLRTSGMVVPHGQWDTWKDPSGRAPYEVATEGTSKWASLTKQVESEIDLDRAEHARW